MALVKITNKFGLPQAFVEMTKSDYTVEPNEYRVTSLLKGIAEVILERRHKDEIEQDVSDMIFLLFGTATHSILERQQEGVNQLKETRIKMKVRDCVLSGQFDQYDADTQTVTDYKTCSVWKVMFGDYADWKKQLLMYAYMLRDAGFPVKRGEIIALMKDHSKRDAKYKADYPKYPVEKISFTFTDKDFDEIERFITDRLSALQRADMETDENLPTCTPEERYNSGDKFAVMKKGKKTALRVLDSMEEAERWKEANGGDYIETRKGEDKKCADYCAVKDFCKYYKESKND